MADGGFRSARRAMWVDAEISGFEVERLHRPLRRLSKHEKAVIVAECHRPDASVARRHPVSSDNLRRCVRQAREAGTRILTLPRGLAGASGPNVHVVN